MAVSAPLWVAPGVLLVDSVQRVYDGRIISNLLGLYGLLAQ